MARPLLIGVGTAYAGDDAAGLAVAERTRGPFDVALASGVAADLVARMEGRDDVLIVDACRSGAAPGMVHRLEVGRDPLPGWLAGVSSHGMGVAEAVGLAKALGILPERCRIWAIEGANFALGADMHPAVEAAVARCVDEVTFD